MVPAARRLVAEPVRVHHQLVKADQRHLVPCNPDERRELFEIVVDRALIDGRADPWSARALVLVVYAPRSLRMTSVTSTDADCR